MEMKNDFSFHFWSWRQKSDATFLLEAVDEGSRINKSGKEQKRLGENTHAHTRKHAHTRTHMHAHTLSQCLSWTHIQSSIFSCYLSLSIEHTHTHTRCQIHALRHNGSHVSSENLLQHSQTVLEDWSIMQMASIVFPSTHPLLCPGKYSAEENVKLTCHTRTTKNLAADHPKFGLDCFNALLLSLG